MKKLATKRNLFAALFLLSIGVLYLVHSYSNNNLKDKEQNEVLQIVHEEGNEASKEQAKKARNNYFFKLLRDPKTNTIPEDIRRRELQHARSIPTLEEVNQRLKAQNPSFIPAQDYNWQLAGPNGVGGRTRALGIDQRNSNIIIAGGVSGGIWRSTNEGNSWTLRTPNAENFSVTSLAQDPTNPDTWYYTSGELIGNSANAPGAPYFGTGIFRSTDNGMNWSRIPGTEDDNTQFDSQFDFVNRIIISPTSGSIFVASNGFGIFRSTNGTDFNNLVLGGAGQHFHADVAVANDGTLVAILSTNDAGDSANNPGIFISTDDGATWSEITPASFPSEYGRSVITFAPSDPDIIYVLSRKFNDDTNQGISFFKIDTSGGLPGIAEDRSANVPNFGEPVGNMELQGGYNMAITVKPDDPNFVLIGGINLFRSTDGFATAPLNNSESEKDKFWIGGYAQNNDVSQYENQHPDQHRIVFDPNDTERVWAGHDGGLSLTNNISASAVNWTDKNNGYVTTQFYDVSIPSGSDDDRLMGGTQDNGTPFFNFNQTQTNSSIDISSGDGGFSFFTQNYILTSNQRNSDRENNRVILYRGNSSYIVHPRNSNTALFINPYEVDPQNQNVMYYPGGNELWRNTSLNEIDNEDDSNGTNTGWELLTSAELPTTHIISSLKVTKNPNNILYYAGSDTTESPQPPILKRLDNASISSDTPVDISIPGAPNGAFVHDIAVNPVDGNEVLVVMSNYNISGLYHSTDAGNSWQLVEGNLTGDNAPSSPNPGPSLRSAAIIPAQGGSIYVLGTSTGIYASQNLDGNNTTWGKEAVNEIGSSVIENIDARFSNGDVAVGTHGRGIFLGSFQGTIDFNAPNNSSVSQNFPNPFSNSTSTSIPVNLANESRVTVAIFDITGQKVFQPITERVFQPGRNNLSITFNSGLASGIYLYRVIAEPTDQGKRFVGTGKMTFIN